MDKNDDKKSRTTDSSSDKGLDCVMASVVFVRWICCGIQSKEEIFLIFLR